MPPLVDEVVWFPLYLGRGTPAQKELIVVESWHLRHHFLTKYHVNPKSILRGLNRQLLDLSDRILHSVRILRRDVSI